MTKQRLAGYSIDRLSADLGDSAAAVETALAAMASQQIIPRIWARDHTVWAPEPSEITNRLGWLDSPKEMAEKAGGLQALAQRIREAGYDQALLLGMGGSSLAPAVFGEVFSPSLTVLDSTDPGAVIAEAQRIAPERTLFIVSTKSGGTVETLSFFKHFYNLTADAVGLAEAGSHFIAITDPGSRLEQLARTYRFRAIILNDPTIGGRNSVLSHFGLQPAAITGVDVPKLLDRALALRARCGAAHPIGENPGAVLGAIMGTSAKAGQDKLTLLVSPAIKSFGSWAEQLVAESTGKDGTGILPVEGEAVGPPSVYGPDRLFVQVCLADDTTYDSAVKELQAAGFPVVRLDLRDVYDLGEQFFLWEYATAVASHLLGVNSFNQPNVETAKRSAREMVAAYQQSGELPRVQTAPLTARSLAEFLSQAELGDPMTGQGRSYVALQAYVQPTPKSESALRRLQELLRDLTQLATTVGYGPRFLHSTGQLHKGDAGKGLFIQFTADDPQDVPIPDEAGSPDSSMSFGVLKAAQALGDRQALLSAGRPVIRFHLGADTEAGLEKLTDSSW